MIHNGEGFAFFRWRIAHHPHIGGYASWWEFYRGDRFLAVAPDESAEERL